MFYFGHGKLERLQRLRIWQTHKYTAVEQAKILILMAELLEQGFSLQESLKFLIKLYHHLPKVDNLKTILLALNKGDYVYQAFSKGNFKAQIIASLKLSEQHGDIQQVLAKLGKQILAEEQRVMKLKQLLQYPFILLTLLLLILCTLKYILFPKLNATGALQNNLMTSFVNHFFVIFTIFTIVLWGVMILIKLKLKSLTVEQKLRIILKLPFLKTWCRYTYTTTFCLEWARLLELGIEVKSLLNLLQEEGNLDWMRYLAKEMIQELRVGNTLASSLQQFKFLLPGLSYLIAEGEMKGQLAKELRIYGEELWNEWLARLEYWLQFVQPIIFIIIGIVIISLYVAILLPMYSYI